MDSRTEDGEPAHASDAVNSHEVASSGAETSGLFSALRIVASSTLVSRILGMFREIASAQLFGLGPTWDAFSFAFVIPNLSRRLFGEGALS
ncbi:MAG: hypothetical protein JSS02_00695, partial [Planctomycetes bacterium]|nr:hypothetical protein [Planctomycetota bacterium]